MFILAALFAAAVGAILLVLNLNWILLPVFYCISFLLGTAFLLLVSTLAPRIVRRSAAVLTEETKHFLKRTGRSVNWYCVEGKGLRVVKGIGSPPDVYIGLELAAQCQPEDLKKLIKKVENKAAGLDAHALTVFELLDEWCGATTLRKSSSINLSLGRALWVFLHLPLAFVLNSVIEKKYDRIYTH